MQKELRWNKDIASSIHIVPSPFQPLIFLLFLHPPPDCPCKWPLLLHWCVCNTWGTKGSFGSRQRGNKLINAAVGIWLSTHARHPNSPCYVSELVNLVKFMQTHYSCSTKPQALLQKNWPYTTGWSCPKLVMELFVLFSLSILLFLSFI